jgi:hypothetical protein
MNTFYTFTLYFLQITLILSSHLRLGLPSAGCLQDERPGFLTGAGFVVFTATSSLSAAHPVSYPRHIGREGLLVIKRSEREAYLHFPIRLHGTVFN